MAAKRTPRTRTETSKAASAAISTQANKAVKSEQDVAAELAQKKAVAEFRASFSAQKAVQGLTSAALDAQKTFAQLQEQIIAKGQELEQLETAKAHLEAEIAELHSKDIIASELGHQIAEYQVKMAELDQRHLAAQEEQTAAVRKFEKEFAETKAAKQLAWQREQEQYQYNRDQDRTRERIEADALVRERDRANQLKQAELERTWAETNREVTARQAEYDKAISEAAQFPEKLKKSEEASFKQGYNTSAKEASHVAALAKAEADQKLALANATIQAKDQTISNMASTIERLEIELNKARTDAKEVATEALRSASGRQALEVATQFGQNTQAAVNGTGRKQ